MKFQILLLSLLTAGVVYSGSVPIPEGRRLRDIIAEKYPKGSLYVGAATCWHKRPSGVGAISDREYNHVTPENDFKQSLIHPKPDKWNWEAADAWVKHCAEIGQTIRVHGPISPQCSKWIREDERTPEVIEQILREYLTALYQRYDKYPHVKWFDVVNEVTHGGTWKKSEAGVKKWEMPWERLGLDKSDSFHVPKYIIIAFEIANKHAPKSQLIINQHTDDPKDWDNIKKLAARLRKKGLRVDGVGWQAHVDTGWEKNPQNIKWLTELIAWAQANDLSFHVTEVNAWVKGNDSDEDQAKTFAAILETTLKARTDSPDALTFNTWNVTDKLAWNKHLKGTLFYENMTAKPAYYAIQTMLENPPKTSR